MTLYKNFIYYVTEPVIMETISLQNPYYYTNRYNYIQLFLNSQDYMMLKIFSFLLGIITPLSIILFSANLPSISSIYAQDIKYTNNTKTKIIILQF